MWIQAFAGGLLIGAAALLLFAALGRIAGISGITFGLLWGEAGDKLWRVLFLLGLAVGGIVAVAIGFPLASEGTLAQPMQAPLLILAGLLVGVGTRLGNGCTSGHGICGLARLSPRSLTAVMAFMAAGFITATLLRPFLI